MTMTLFHPTTPVDSSSPPAVFDDCDICKKNNLDVVPENNTPKILTRLECNHFFHQFCLQSFLNNLGNKTEEPKCPTCQQIFNAEQITYYEINSGIEILKGTYKNVILFKNENKILTYPRRITS